MNDNTGLTIGPAARDAAAVAVMLHGRGQSPAMMREQARGLMTPDLRCVLPQAPDGTWYPRRFLAPIAENEPQLSASLARIEAIVVEKMAADVPAGRIILLGFSQGACLAAEFVIRYPRRYGALIVWTGGLIGPPGTQWPLPDMLRGLPVLVTGSDVDEFVPAARARETAAHFVAAGAQVDLRIYPGRDHVVSEPEVLAAAALVAAAKATPRG
jgi:phospholipase/carboxylesterase